ncbi:hypothetical protein MANES_10G054501v8 [Manihot esculenta]|uniref:Uncharacterized protein n=1 Tax=Manihot esculenta TaxID=3983 RepID=A0ACB7GZB3_MANES|nr:hypothetical protein MANES_10G054501v8 [Manihot esculenta]
MSAGISDHSPLIMKILGVINRRNVPFRFFNMWVSHPKYDGIVGREWQLKELKWELKKLNRREFFDISRRVDNYRQMIEQLQESLQSDPMNLVFLDEERAVMSYFRNLLEHEEEFYKQKSKLIWVQYEDFNTKFFHNSMKIRWVRNSIPNLVVEERAPGVSKFQNFALSSKNLQIKVKTH